MGTEQGTPAYRWIFPGQQGEVDRGEETAGRAFGNRFGRQEQVGTRAAAFLRQCPCEAKH